MRRALTLKRARNFVKVRSDQSLDVVADGRDDVDMLGGDNRQARQRLAVHARRHARVLDE